MKRIYLVLSRISDFAQKPLEILCALCMATSLLAVFFQVLYRYVIVKYVTFSFPFTEEYARYTIVWVTYLLGGICIKEDRLVSLNLLYDKLSGKSKYALYYLTRVLILMFLYVVVAYGFSYLPQALMFKSPILRLTGVVLHMMPVYGCIIMGYETVVDVLGVICGEQLPFVGRRPQEEGGSTT